jgi:hypothetical protein
MSIGMSEGVEVDVVLTDEVRLKCGFNKKRKVP